MGTGIGVGGEISDSEGEDDGCRKFSCGGRGVGKCSVFVGWFAGCFRGWV